MNDFLISKLNNYYSKNDIDRIISNMQINKAVTFRLNYCRGDNKNAVEDEFKSKNIKFSILNLKNEFKKLYNDGFLIINYDISNFNVAKYLDNDLFDFNFYVVALDEENKDIINSIKNNIINLDCYKKGYIYMQNPSTFLSALLIEPKSNDNILDMCAAPGGKSMMIQSMMNNKSNITACEINNIRYEKMIYNFKLQNANIYSLNQDARELNDNLKFDKILVDVPCSGSGTLDISNDNYEKYFTDLLIDKSVKRQLSLLKKSTKLVNKNGLIVYSTCSILNQENEEMINCINLKNWIYMKILPTKVFEGFFALKFNV